MVTPAAFVTTLCTEPQVVTIALQILVAQGISSECGIIVHTSENTPAILGSLANLEQAFLEPPFSGVKLELLILCANGLPFAAIITEHPRRATFRDLFVLVKRLKRESHQIHFSVAGGRNVKPIYGLAVAQVLLESNDILYYVFSADSVAEERRVLLRSDDRAVPVPIPFKRWPKQSAAIAEVLLYDHPLRAMAHDSRNINRGKGALAGIHPRYPHSSREKNCTASRARRANEQAGRTAPWKTY